jgi:hypothetical protein
MTRPAAPAPLSAILASQQETGKLQPGDPGYWQVWGARAADIRPGDLVMMARGEGDARQFYEFQCAECLPTRPDHLIGDTCQPRFRTTDGRVLGVGMVQRIKIVRYGTHNTLADSA